MRVASGDSETWIKHELATKDDFIAMEERLSLHMQATGETMIRTLLQHIEMAVESAVARAIAPLEQRVSRLEEKLGLYSVD